MGYPRRCTARIGALLFGLICLGLPAPGMALEPARQVTWENLIPEPGEALRQRIKAVEQAFDALSGEQQEHYFEIDKQMSLQARVDSGFVDKDRLRPHEREQLDKGAKAEHPELFDLWQRISGLRAELTSESKRVNASLDGTRIRMPGYVLPLEHEGSAVREFLLVPFVGACIHVPPPPPNQMVFVKADKPFNSKGLYEAVWVEGVISSAGGSHALSLVDGQSDVSTAYSMQALEITPHTP